MNLLATGRLGIIGGMLLVSGFVLAQNQASSAGDPNLRTAYEGGSLPPAPPVRKAGSGDLRVVFRDGLLQIDAENSLLSLTLKTLAARMNARLEFPVGRVDELVFAHLGPASAREVIAQLLNGSGLNYVISFSPSDPGTVTGLRLTTSDPSSENASATTPAVISEPAAPELYGAGFTVDSDNLSPVEPVTDGTEASSSGGDQRAKLAHQDGAKLSGEDLDRMQKAQIKQEQNCTSGTDGVPHPGCAATKEDFQ